MRIIFFFLLQLAWLFTEAQPQLQTGVYRAFVIREDGQEVRFDLEIRPQGKIMSVFVWNATERIALKNFKRTGDSVFFAMPVFESEFKSQIQPDGSLKGTWYKGTANKIQEWPFRAVHGKPRFDITSGNAKYNISGKWSVTITRANGTKRFALAEFVQKGNKLTGTFLTPSGDYRYLSGVVTGNALMLSTFDGAHAYSFTANVQDSKTIKDGFFGSGIAGVETWEAEKNPNAVAPVQDAPTRFKPGESTLNFTFNDPEGRPVSFADKRFENKVVIVQLMGSWCPNCMDETKFLSEYYNKNKGRGVEVVALAYEYSTDSVRSINSLKKFRDKFNVQYPMLLTGATASDESKTEKTLPQLTPIRSFPTTLIFDKQGRIRQIHGTFYGPGTGVYFEKLKKDFYSTIHTLLSE
jgi:peroxiredoxin